METILQFEYKTVNRFRFLSYDEYKEIVEKIGDRASFSLFKFDNHHEGETDTVLQYQYNLYQKG